MEEVKEHLLHPWKIAISLMALRKNPPARLINPTWHSCRPKDLFFLVPALLPTPATCSVAEEVAAEEELRDKSRSPYASTDAIKTR